MTSVSINFRTQDKGSMSITFGENYPDSQEILDCFDVINSDDYKNKLKIKGYMKRKKIVISGFKNKAEAQNFINNNELEVEGIQAKIL